MDTAYSARTAPDHPFRDAFDIEFRLDQEAGRVVALRTAGLSDFGFPELLVLPDEPFLPTAPACPCGCPPPWPETGGHPDDQEVATGPEAPDDDQDGVDRQPEADAAAACAQHAVRCAQMLSLLALDVLTEDTLDVLPRSEDLLDVPVRFWLGEPEVIRYRPPDGPGFDELMVPVHWVIE